MENDNYTNKIKKLIVGIKNNPNDKEVFLKKLRDKNPGKLIISIKEIIDEEIMNFSYTNNHDISYLIYALELLDELLENNKYNEIINNYLNKIYPELTKLLFLKNEINNNSKIANKKYKSLLSILDKIDNNMNNYKHITDSNNINEEAIIYYTIFTLKSFSTIENLLKKSPNLINIIDKKGNPIIKKIIWHYLLSLKTYILDDNRIDLIYYDRLFKRFINDKKLRLTEIEKELLIKQINDFIKDIPLDRTKKQEELTYYKNKIILGLLGNLKEDNSIKNLNYEYGIREDFNPAIQSEATRIYLLNKNITKPVNKASIYTFDHNPNEIDDGVSIKEYDGLLKVTIYIANPTALLSTDSIILKEARKRTESLYFENKGESKVISMLPEILSKGIMGLNENTNTHAMAFSYTFDKISGNIIKQEINSEIVKIDKNFDYEEFDYYLRYGADEKIIKDFSNIEKVSTFFAKEYDNTLVKELIGPNSKSSRGINVITNLMIGNNIHTARLFNERELPFAYRNHKLDERKNEINNIKKKVLNRDPITSIFKLLEELDNICPNASYSPVCLGHDSLKAEEYSHTTSPLRRYIDILNMLCINKFILGTYTKEDIKKYTEMIYIITEEINSKRQFLSNYSKEYERRLALSKN